MAIRDKFLSANAKSATIKVLRSARDAIAKGFCKGQYMRSTPAGMQYCALGALSVGEDAVPFNEDKWHIHLMANQILSEAIDRKWRKVNGPNIPRYNDMPHRTQKQMVNLFKRAILKAKQIKVDHS